MTAETLSPQQLETPFTCKYCRNAAADHLLVLDLYLDGAFRKRVTDLVCRPCGRYSQSVSGEPHFRAVRLFELAPVDHSKEPS